MYDEKIKKYLYNEEYDLLIQEVDKEIEDNSFEASFYYYRFLAKNKDYSHMDFNNFIDKDDYNRAMELDFMHTFETEFKFFKILNNEERKLFQYANHMNIAKFNEAIKSFNVSTSNTFLNRDEARALSEYANTLTENTQKELTGKLLLVYTQDRKWDPTLRSVKNMVEDVVLLFESSLFHKIEKEETKKEIKEDQPTFPNSSIGIDSTTKVKKEDIHPLGNIDIPKEEGKTISKQANTNVDVEPKKNVTITPPKDYSSIKAPKRMYSNGSTYISGANFDDEELYNVKKDSGNQVKKAPNRRFVISLIVAALFVGIIIFLAVYLQNHFGSNKKQTNYQEPTYETSSTNNYQYNGKALVALRSMSEGNNKLNVELNCSNYYYGKTVWRIDGTLIYMDFDDYKEYDCTIYSAVDSNSKNSITISFYGTENYDPIDCILEFRTEYIFFEDGTHETHVETIEIYS